jgi:phosphoacetylglucosamine mutase
VKTQQKLPPSLKDHIKPGQRGCSLDGDADRLMYFYLTADGAFRMLDGDKIGALVAAFIGELVDAAGLAGAVKVGIVQTAYANGASTRYLSARVPVTCVPTGVKHLHHAAEAYDVGVYFEANGHGTVLFSPKTLATVREHKGTTAAQTTALGHLANLIDVINQTVGDALSDMLLVEAVLAHKSYGPDAWDALYADLPNRLVKVVVKDRNVFTTEDAERKLVTPHGLQAKVDAFVAKFGQGRSFVRPSGTEDVVRVYGEAATREEADSEWMSFNCLNAQTDALVGLAFSVAGLVYDEVGGDASERPSEFL